MKYSVHATLLLAILLLAVATSASSQEDPQVPELTITSFVEHHDRNIPEPYRSFQGVLLEKALVIELHPILPYIFFDLASGELPSRYRLFTRPDETNAFSDTTVLGGTLQKYYHLLNIIGYRMRKYPETTITLGGYNSTGSRAPEQPGENPEVSRKRQQSIYDYLTNIWKIDPNRIHVLAPGKSFPPLRSNPSDPRSLEENRRAEISSDDWEIMKPILDVEYRYVPVAGTIGFQISTTVPDSLLREGEIVIAQPSGERSAYPYNTNVYSLEHWYRGRGVKLTDTLLPFSAQVVTRMKDGRELRSDPLTIPTLYLPVTTVHGEELHSLRVGYYGFVLSNPDNGGTTRLQERILKEYICSEIHLGATVRIVGTTDLIGSADRNLKLSYDKAAAIRASIKHSTPTDTTRKMRAEGFGETSPIYPNILPEGRMYNRAVVVEVWNHSTAE